MPMIEKAKSSKFINRWTMAAGAVVVGGGLLMLGQGDNNNEKQREPEAASADNAAPRVDATRRFFVARVPSNFYRRRNAEEGSLIGTFQPGSCVVMVGEAGPFTNTHIRSNTPGPASVYTDSANFENTDITNEAACIATVLGVQTGGFAPRERYYTIGGNVPVPLYRNPSGEGEVLAYLAPNSCAMRDGTAAMMPLIAQNAEGVRHRGYAPFESSPYGTFNSPLGEVVTLTDATCKAVFVSATSTVTAPALPSVAPPAPTPPPAPTTP